jgi:hypothetical protein
LRARTITKIGRIHIVLAGDPNKGLTAPDFERFAFTPCPMASLASSGIKALSSLLARSWSRKALRVLRKSAANSAQELDALISTMRTASMRGRGGSALMASVPSTTPSRVAAIHGIAECLTLRWTSETRRPVLRSYQQVELLGGGPELHDEVAGQVLRLGLAPFLVPEAD